MGKTCSTYGEKRNASRVYSKDGRKEILESYRPTCGVILKWSGFILLSIRMNGGLL
jgi:hypothetical protein